MEYEFFRSLADLSHQIPWVNIISFVSGALIASFISYLFAKKRENELLKIKLRIETSEQMIESILNFTNKSSLIQTLNYSVFKNYNELLMDNQAFESKSIGFYGVKSSDNIINEKKIKRGMDAIFEFEDKYIELCEEYHNSLFCILSILVTKEVILNPFIEFRRRLSYEHEELSEIRTSFLSFYYSEIRENVSSKNLINEANIKKIDDFKSQFTKKTSDITSIIYDLQVDLQNEFLSKLFGHTVKGREPIRKT